MLKAKHINQIEDINKLSEDITIVSIGNDFCERLIVKDADFVSFYELTRKRNLQLRLKTPFITESYIDDYCKLMEKISEDEMEIDITINDYGLLDYIQQNGLCQKCSFTLGRLLTRQKTDNLTGQLKDKVKDDTYSHFCTPVAQGAGYDQLYSKYRITHMEVENVEHEIILSKEPSGVKFVLLYPYVSVASTRLCPYAIKDRDLKLSNCSKRCRQERYSVQDDIQGRFVYINNTIAYKNDVINRREIEGKFDILLDETWRF